MMNDDPDAITPGYNKSSSPSSEVKVCGENLACTKQGQNFKLRTSNNVFII